MNILKDKIIQLNYPDLTVLRIFNSIKEASDQINYTENHIRNSTRLKNEKIKVVTVLNNSVFIRLDHLKKYNISLQSKRKVVLIKIKSSGRYIKCNSFTIACNLLGLSRNLVYRKINRITNVYEDDKYIIEVIK